MTAILGVSMAKILLASLTLTLLATLSTAQQSSPDLILLNGTIFTGHLAHADVEALAIRIERIVAGDSSERIVEMAGPQDCALANEKTEMK